MFTAMKRITQFVAAPLTLVKRDIHFCRSEAHAVKPPSVALVCT